MTELRGMPVVKAIAGRLKEQIEQMDVIPCLAVVRVGNKDDDLAYEKGILKRFSAVGAKVCVHELPLDITPEDFEQKIEELNNDGDVHAILVFKPLPESLKGVKLNELIAPWKDADCVSDINMAKLFSGAPDGFAPCTAQAVIEILDHYDIDVEGKNVVIVGRSLVVGKPLIMLLLKKNATVTVCHTRTRDLKDKCRKADIIVTCAGKAGVIDEDCIGENQTVIDVGINFLDGEMVGDVARSAVELAAAITPVPGGVGTVTTSVLLKHTVMAAMKTKDC